MYNQFSLPKNLEFYDKKRIENYSHEINSTDPTKHGHYLLVKKFIDEYELRNKKCLEIGSGIGLFQDMVLDYTGTDIADSIKSYYHKPYVISRVDGRYPFEDNSFDAIWTITVFEHIPELNTALNEVKRILKPGGLILFAPAWECTKWAAEGYPVRPYTDFDIKGKAIKCILPIRESIVWRLIYKVPKRIYRHFKFMLGCRNTQIEYKKLRVNWEKFWMSDSDACNSIDPHDAILWFESNGFSCLSHPMHFKALTCHSCQGLVFKRNV